MAILFKLPSSTFATENVFMRLRLLNFLWKLGIRPRGIDTIRVMEYLTFNPQGQWTLHKAAIVEPGTLKDPTGPSKKPPFHSITTSTEQGQLPEDRGQRGTLHNFNQGKRPKPSHLMGRRKWGEPTHRVANAYENQNPGTQQ